MGMKKRVDFGRFTAAQIVKLDVDEEGGGGDGGTGAGERFRPPGGVFFSGVESKLPDERKGRDLKSTNTPLVLVLATNRD